MRVWNILVCHFYCFAYHAQTGLYWLLTLRLLWHDRRLKCVSGHCLHCVTANKNSNLLKLGSDYILYYENQIIGFVDHILQLISSWLRPTFCTCVQGPLCLPSWSLKPASDWIVFVLDDCSLFEHNYSLSRRCILLVYTYAIDLFPSQPLRSVALQTVIAFIVMAQREFRGRKDERDEENIVWRESLKRDPKHT